jgi:hypothetical protein
MHFSRREPAGRAMPNSEIVCTLSEPLGLSGMTRKLRESFQLQAFSSQPAISPQKFRARKINNRRNAFCLLPAMD